MKFKNLLILLFLFPVCLFAQPGFPFSNLVCEGDTIINNIVVNTIDTSGLNSYKPSNVFVATDGDDLSYKKGYSSFPALTINHHKNDSKFRSGDMIFVEAGQFDLANSGNYLVDQLGKEGDSITYVLEPGATLVNNGVDMGTGLGRWDNYITQSSEFNILGSGRIINTTNLPGNVSMGIYGNIKSRIKLASIDCNSTAWAVQTGGVESYIDVDEIRVNGGTAYSSYGTTEDVDFHHVFHAGTIFNAGNSHALRIQGLSTSLGNSSSSLIEVDNILITGTGVSSDSYYFQRDVGLTNHSEKLRIGNIINTGTALGGYTSNSYLSNDTKATELYFGGGSSSFTNPHTNVNVDIEVGSIQTTKGIISFNGQAWDNSHVNFNVKNAYSSDVAAIHVAAPQMRNNSTCTITGKYVNDGNASIYFHVESNAARYVDSTSYIEMRGWYETLATGEPVIRFNCGASETPQTEQLIFRNAHFQNDGTSPLVSTNSSNNFEVHFINCTTNTALFSNDANVSWTGDLKLGVVRTHEEFVRFNQSILDSDGDPGTPGQKLTPNLTGGVDWVDDLGGSSENIYNTSDTLTADRQLTGNGNTLTYEMLNGSNEFKTEWLTDKFGRRLANVTVSTEVTHLPRFWQAFTQGVGSNAFNVLSNVEGVTSMKEANASEGGESEVYVYGQGVGIDITGPNRDLKINFDAGDDHQMIRSFGDSVAPAWRHLEMRLLAEVNKPSSPESGEFYYNTDSGNVELWDVANWVSIASSNSTIGKSAVITNSNTNQNLNEDANWITIILDSIEFNELGITIDSTGFTVIEAGTYRLTASASVQSSATRIATHYSISPSKVLLFTTYIRQVNAIDSWSGTGSITLQAEVGDKFSFECIREGSVAGSLNAEAAKALRFEITRLQ